MKKFLSILMVIVMMLSIGLTSVAADTPEIKLNDMGLLLNISNAELDATLTRDIGVTMILKSLGYTQADADAEVNQSPFDDVTDWAKGWAALAYKLGITTGVSAIKFDPKGILTEKQFVAFQLRALEYNTNDAWNNAVVLGRSSGLISVTNTLVDSNYTKREAAIVMYNALSSKLQNEKVPLIDQLVEDGVVTSAKAEKYGLKTTDFKVLKVDASNLKVMTLSVSQDIDEDSLTNDTVKILKDETSMLFDTNILDGIPAYKYAFDVIDSKTVNIVFGSPNAQNDIITIDVNGLLDTKGQEINDYKADYKLKDQTNPYIISVLSPNPKQIKVTYSEPVQYKTGSKVFDDVFLDGLRLAAEATLSVDKQELMFEVPDSMVEGSHELTIESTIDYAGLPNSDGVFTFEVENDTEDPYVVNASANNRNKVTIEFNETINTTAGKIVIANKTYSINDDSKVTVNDNVVVIELDVSLTASSAFTAIKGSYDDIEDFVGNKVSSEVSFSFYAEFDDELPTLTASVTSGNEIIVTFSEPVASFTTLNFVVIEVVDDEDILKGVSSVSASGSSDSVFKITLSTNIIDKATYILKVKAVKDVSVIQNTLADTEVELAMNDLKRPLIMAVKRLNDDLVRITFSEPMNKSMLLDGDNYIVDDDSENKTMALSAVVGYEIDVDSDLEYVDLTIPDITTSDRISLAKLEDASGSILQNYNTYWSVGSPNDFTASDLDARLIDTKTIKLIASNHEFLYINGYDFKIRSSSGESITHYIQSATIDSEDASIAYLKLNTSLGSDARHDGKTQYLYMADEIITMDLFDQQLEIAYASPLKIEDYVIATLEVDLDTSDTIIIDFSEVMSAGSNTQIVDDVILRNKDGVNETLTIGGNTILSGGSDTFAFFNQITISGLVGGESYTLEVVSRNIQDDDNNPVEALERITFEVKE